MEQNIDYKQKFEEQVEGTSRLVAECNAWREKYRGLAKDEQALWERYNNVVDESAAMSAELTALRSECAAAMKKLEDAELSCKENEKQLRNAKADIEILEKSNGYMEAELIRINAIRNKLEDKCDELSEDNKRMHNQSLWERIFNR